MDIIRTYPGSLLKADAIRTVGNLRCKEGLSLIETYLASENRDTRYASIISLGWMGSKKQIDLLFAVYKSENDALLRGYAITALRQIFFNHNEEKQYIISGIKNTALKNMKKTLSVALYYRHKLFLKKILDLLRTRKQEISQVAQENLGSIFLSIF